MLYAHITPSTGVKGEQGVLTAYHGGASAGVLSQCTKKCCGLLFGGTCMSMVKETRAVCPARSSSHMCHCKQWILLKGRIFLLHSPRAHRSLGKSYNTTSVIGPARNDVDTYYVPCCHCYCVHFSAVNLGQGFPSFAMPEFAKRNGKCAHNIILWMLEIMVLPRPHVIARQAIKDDFNQYR